MAPWPGAHAVVFVSRIKRIINANRGAEETPFQQGRLTFFVINA